MATIALGCLLAALLWLSLRRIWRDRAKGRSCWAEGCGGACGACRSRRQE